MPGLGKHFAKMLVRTYQRCRIILRVPIEQRIGALNGNYKYVYSVQQCWDQHHICCEDHGHPLPGMEDDHQGVSCVQDVLVEDID